MTTTTRVEPVLLDLLVVEAPVLDLARATRLARSIAAGGLREPPVCKATDRGYVVLEGTHRVLACRLLAETDPQTYWRIPCRVL